MAVAAALVLLIAGAAFLVSRQNGGDTTAADSADLATTTTVAGLSEDPATAPPSDAAESATAGAADDQGSNDLGSYGTTAELRAGLGDGLTDPTTQGSRAEGPTTTSAPTAPDPVAGADRTCRAQLGTLGAEWVGTATVAGRSVVVGRRGDADVGRPGTASVHGPPLNPVRRVMPLV